MSKGFAAGHAGDHRAQEAADIIWCAAYQQFQDRYPWLPQATDQDDHAQYACVDLTVTLNRGQIARVDLEGQSLKNTFLATDQLPEAQRAHALIGAPAGANSQQLASLLAALFSG